MESIAGCFDPDTRTLTEVRVNIVYLVLGALLGAVLVVLGVQNTQLQSFRFFGWYTPEVPVLIALAIALATGLLLGWLISAPARLRQRHRVHDLEERLVAAEHRATAAVAANEHRSEEPVPRSPRLETPPAE